MYKLLIAEDVEIIRNMLVHTMDWVSIGVTVSGVAENGKQALEIIEKETPDILLTDIRMPLLDGLQLIKEATKRYPGIKCVILTAHGDFEYAKSAIKLDVVDFVLKPINTDELSQAIQKARNLMEEQKQQQILRGIVNEKFRNLNEREDVMKLQGSMKNKKIIETAMDYIKAHLHASIPVEDVADTVNLNAKYLTTLFKQVTGESISKYIVKCKLEKAAELLKDPGIKVYEVCDRVGYTDQNYFRDIFTKHFGVSPSEYKNRIL